MVIRFDSVLLYRGLTRLLLVPSGRGHIHIRPYACATRRNGRDGHLYNIVLFIIYIYISYIYISYIYISYHIYIYMNETVIEVVRRGVPHVYSASAARAGLPFSYPGSLVHDTQLEASTRRERRDLYNLLSARALCGRFGGAARSS